MWPDAKMSYAEGEEPGTEGYMHYDAIYIKF